MARRVTVFLYGALTYVFFLGTFSYAIGFIMDMVVPKSINDGVATPFELALLINVALLGLFGVQHTIMARPAFKRWWTKIIPAAAERSTFVLATNVILCALFWQWRPMPAVVWHVDNEVFATALLAVSWAGWGIVLLSTYLIDHFELFGLKQAWYCLRDKAYPVTAYKERLFYKVVRHPLMFGFMVAFWSTPHMTLSRLVFAVVTTAYVLFGLQIEERDLVKAHGAAYEDYRRRVPMLIPFLGGRRKQALPLPGKTVTAAAPESEQLAGL